MRAKVITDGRGNAGTGACAAVLFLPDGRVIEKAEKIKPSTNIVAEHLSIQLGIVLALQHEVRDLLIWNDSQTPVRQILGLYQTKMTHLKPLIEETWDLALQFDSVDIEWVPREKTKFPDELCRKVDPPSQKNSSRR